MAKTLNAVFEDDAEWSAFYASRIARRSDWDRGATAGFAGEPMPKPRSRWGDAAVERGYAYGREVMRRYVRYSKW